MSKEQKQFHIKAAEDVRDGASLKGAPLPEEFDANWLLDNVTETDRAALEAIKDLKLREQIMKARYQSLRYEERSKRADSPRGMVFQNLRKNDK